MIPTIRFRNRLWRVLAPRWAHAPLSGEGAARHGGRFNERGMPALYLSEDPMTAFSEYQQELGVRPGTFCAFDVDVDGVADLTDAATLAAAGAGTDDLACPWKEVLLVRRGRPPTWDLVARLLDAGVAGARVPSFRRNGGVNLVLWRWNDAPSRTVKALDPLGDLTRGS